MSVLWNSGNQLYSRDNHGLKITVIVLYDQSKLIRENKSSSFLSYSFNVNSDRDETRDCLTEIRRGSSGDENAWCWTDPTQLA